MFISSEKTAEVSRAFAQSAPEIYVNGLYLSSKIFLVDAVADSGIHVILMPDKENAEYFASDIYNIRKSESIYLLPVSGARLEKSARKATCNVQRTAAISAIVDYGKRSSADDKGVIIVTYPEAIEEEFVDSTELEQILEDMSIYWNDDLAYSLTFVCKTLKSLSKGERWSMPPLYQSDMMSGPGVESDKAFVNRLLQAAITGYDRYSARIAAAVDNWDNERIVSTDMSIIVLGLSEAVEFPEIPVKVTINEYVEISKYYGTPKSRIFVNGLLDRLISAMEQEGIVSKRVGPRK